ncbi:Four and a half LIM domains protein [Entamoeba marina]
MPLIKIKVQVDNQNKVFNVERTEPNVYDVLAAEIEKKLGKELMLFYNMLIISDNAGLQAAIDDCINSREPFLQLTGRVKKAKSTPAKEPTKPVATQPPKQEPPKQEPPKQELPKQEPPKQEPPKQQSGGNINNNNGDDDDYCAKCGKIVGSGVKALGKFWHSECFTCCECGNSFGGERKLMELNGNPLCSLCHQENHTEKCFSCNKPLISSYVTAGDNKYHPECFRCSQCNNPIQGSYLIKGGNIVCKTCA